MPSPWVAFDQTSLLQSLVFCAFPSLQVLTTERILSDLHDESMRFKTGNALLEFDDRSRKTVEVNKRNACARY